MSEPAEGEGPGKKDITRWTPSMEEAYLAALEKVGGLEAAKPRAILDELQAEFPHLTLQACKWHLLAHRRRIERHKVMQPQGIAPPTKWTGRLEAAYEAAVARLGGLSSATPKPVYESLQNEFPEVTLQHVKTHMQKQRRKEQRGGGQQGSQATGMQRQASSGLERGQSQEAPQRPANAAAAAAAFVGPSAAKFSPAGPARLPFAAAAATSPAAASSKVVSRPPDSWHQQQQQQQQQASLPPPPQQQQAPSPPLPQQAQQAQLPSLPPQQHAQPAQQQRQPSPPQLPQQQLPLPPQLQQQQAQWQAGSEQPRLVSSSALQTDPQVLAMQEQAAAVEGQLSLVQQARLMLQAAGLQLPGSEPLTGVPTAEDLQRALAVQHAVEALGPHLLPGAQQTQQAQQVQQAQQPLTDQQLQQVAALLLAELAPAAGLAAAQQMPPPPPRPAPRFNLSPVPQAWHAQLLPAAQHAQLVASRQALHCRQCVVQLERQAEQLVELLQALRQSQGSTSSGGGGTEETIASTALTAQPAAQQAQQAQQAGSLAELIPFHLHKLVQRLVARSSPVSSGKGATTHASSRQQRHAARIASAFTVISGKDLQAQQGQQAPQHAPHAHQAQHAQQAQQGQMEVDQPGPAVPPPPRPGEWKLTHNPATCVIPGCPMCLFEEGMMHGQVGGPVPSG